LNHIVKPLNQNKMKAKIAKDIEEALQILDEQIAVIEESLRGDGTDEAREWCEKYLIKLQKKRDKLLKSE